MQTIHTIKAMRQAAADYRRANERIGFVPTMGDLHAGHLDLIDEAARRARRVVASIFVNPTQFGPDEDYDRYPRAEKEDAEKLRSRGVDILFLPDVKEMYGDPNDTTIVTVPSLRGILCGKTRPVHFDGVATIVCKLFHIVSPDVAVFGQKDYQQLVLIRRVVAELAMPVEIVGAPTRREADGLAMSSRNRYLDRRQRAIAPRLYAELRRAVAKTLAGSQAGDLGGGLTLDNINNEVWQNLTQAGFQPEYVAIRRQTDLKPPRTADITAEDKKLVMLAAVGIGQNRLIDNIAFELPA